MKKKTSRYTEEAKSLWTDIWMKGYKAIRERTLPGIWMSMGITLTTLPITAYCYYEIPMYSPLINSFVLPILTPIFALALFGGLIGCVVPIAGKILLIPCGWLFTFYEWICEIAGHLPFGSVIIGKPEAESILLYYAVLFIGCLWIHYRMVQQQFIRNQAHSDKR